MAILEKGGSAFLILGGLISFAIGFIYLLYVRMRYTYNPSADNDRRASWVSYSVILCVVGLIIAVIGAILAGAA
jgi:uncharacterized membrane-anchored protein